MTFIILVCVTPGSRPLYHPMSLIGHHRVMTTTDQQIKTLETGETGKWGKSFNASMEATTAEAHPQFIWLLILNINVFWHIIERVEGVSGW